MDHSLRVRVGHGVADLLEDPETLAQAPASGRMLVQAAAPHQLHRVEAAAVGQDADVVHGHQAGMLQPREDPGLLPHPLDRRGVVGGHDLERHLARQLAVAGDVHRAHPPAGQRPHQLVLRTAEVRRIAGRALEARDGGVREPPHGPPTPRMLRTSSRNSSSLAVSLRSSSSTERRNSRRAAASSFVTCVTGSPNSRASSS